MIAIRLALALTHLDTILLFHCFDALFNDRVYHRWKMLNLLFAVLTLHPLSNVKVSGSVQWDRITIEQIWHEDEVARHTRQILRVQSSLYSPICCELIGHKLSIVETMTDNIGDAVLTVSKLRTH